MIDEFIKLFSGLKENFGQIKLKAKVEFDKERNKIKPEYIWSKQPVIQSTHYQQHIDGKIS